MEHDEIVAAIADLKARHDESRKWVQGEILSLMENDAENGRWLVRMESELNGEDSGLRWRISRIESRWRFVAAVAGGGLAIAVAVAGAVLSEAFVSWISIP